MRIFNTDFDRKYYLQLLSEQGKRFGVKYIGYCLMSNHVHLIAIPLKENSLARGIGEAHRLYTRMVNFRDGVRGYLFQGRFYSCPLDERHTIAAIRYVEHNPVKAGICCYPWEYKWSSAKYNVGEKIDDVLVMENDTIETGRAWKEILLDNKAEEEFIEKSTKTGRPCGDSSFIKKCEKITGLNLTPEKPGPKENN